MLHQIMGTPTGELPLHNLRMPRTILHPHVQVLDVENLAATSYEIHWLPQPALIDFQEKSLASLQPRHPCFDAKLNLKKTLDRG